MSGIARSFFIALSAVAAWGQTAPVFEGASIKPTPPDQANVGVHIEGSQITCAGLSLKEYIRMATKLKDYQVVGPEWLDSQRFDVTATLPAGSTREQIPAMTMALLTERFSLKFHRDKKEFAAWGLAVDKAGLKMKPSLAHPDDKAAAADLAASAGQGGISANLGNGAWFIFNKNQFTGRNLTMANLADSLSRFMDKPVVDMTGTPGRYDVTLALSPTDFRIMLIRAAVAAGANVPPQALKLLNEPMGQSLQLALGALGLRMDFQRAPIDVIVVDHIEQSPK
jgi:uncharacterized protein (TIGR03435 family)